MICENDIVVPIAVIRKSLFNISLSNTKEQDCRREERRLTRYTQRYTDPALPQGIDIFPRRGAENARTLGIA